MVKVFQSIMVVALGIIAVASGAALENLRALAANANKPYTLVALVYEDGDLTGGKMFTVAPSLEQCKRAAAKVLAAAGTPPPGVTVVFSCAPINSVLTVGTPADAAPKLHDVPGKTTSL